MPIHAGKLLWKEAARSPHRRNTMAGHSKWKQIKHKKAITDTKKSQLFSKLVREIVVAVREAGNAPGTNSRLRTAMERARAMGLPKDNIERAIARATGEGGDAGLLQEFCYEVTAPENVMIIVEGITDNKNRTLNEVRQIVAEHHARLADQGSLLWNLEKIGALEIRHEDNPSLTEEAIEMALVDAGAEDFIHADGMWAVETKFQERERVRKGLEVKGVIVSLVGHDYKSRVPLALPQEKIDAIEPILEALSNQSDTQEVYTNLVSPPRSTN